MNLKKTLPPIDITVDNKAIGPSGNRNGKCCGRCGCAEKSPTASLKSGSGWWQKIFTALNKKTEK